MATFFFSGRTRYASSLGVWSTVVCSSDLIPVNPAQVNEAREWISDADPFACFVDLSRIHPNGAPNFLPPRPEKRRVGAEGRSQGRLYRAGHGGYQPPILYRDDSNLLVWAL